MIVITGAAGFIASNVVKLLNENNFNDVVIVDDFSKTEKKYNNNFKLFFFVAIIFKEKKSRLSEKFINFV